MSNIKTYQVIGLMSGSSLDGLDIAYCSFTLSENKNALADISWKLIKAETIPFSDMWVSRLANLPTQNALAFSKTHTYFGHYMAELVNDFLQKHQVEPDFIASHGHTIFHYPEKLMTMQIGDGAALAAKTGYPVICDFRTHDIALEGEGTPIAPAADRYLFKEYDFLLNIGGIANITLNNPKGPTAFDIGPANQVFNMLAQQANQAFDKDGLLAAAGTLDQSLLHLLNQNDYFDTEPPKSLDNQWIQTEVFPVYRNHSASINDQLHTASQQLAEQTAKAIDYLILKEGLNKADYKLLATGGGALNQFLIKCMEEKVNERYSIKIEVPHLNIVLYKEAILMGLMGVLRVENIANCFSSVTGASRDTVGGAIYQGWKRRV